MAPKKYKEIKSVTIILKPVVTHDFSSILPNLTTWLSRRKVQIFFHELEIDRLTKIFSTLPKNIGLLNEQDLFKTDLVITMGGDGTLIGVSRRMPQGGPPIFGINMGRLGFITEFSKVDFYEELAQTIQGRYEINRVHLFKAQVTRRGKKRWSGHYLNDVVINKNDISRMFSLSAETNNEHIFNLSGDGLIISSPIGSTAYSLAAGGPIIHPDVNSMVMTPICPHALTHRPIVIPSSMPLKVRPGPKAGNVTLTLDGQEAISINSQDIVSISKNKRRYVSLIRNPSRLYFQTLKEKFTHGRR